MEISPETKFLTIAEAAVVLRDKGLLRSSNPQSVKKLIDKGLLKTVGEGRMIRVTPETIQDYISGNPDPIPEDGAISVEAQKTIQTYTDDTALAKAQIAKINAEIQRDEAVKRRDLPESLKQRNIELSEKIVQLELREQTIREKEVNQANRDIVLNDKQAQTNRDILEANNYYVQRKVEADTYLTSCHTETDGKVKQALELAQVEADKILNEAKENASKIKFDTNNLGIDLTNKTTELSNLDGKILEAQKSLDAIGLKVKAYLPQVVVQATTHYNTARRTSGNVSNYHDNKANQGWDLEKEIKKVLKSLGF